MDFFGIGAGELVLILVLALIIWGPGKLPEIARTLGRMVRVLKKASFDLTSEVTKEIEREEKDQPSPPRQKSNIKPRNRRRQTAGLQHGDDQSRNVEKQ